MNKNLLDLITKPTFILNEQRARENIRLMSQKARLTNVQFRPHFKTHQSMEIGSWFRDEGVHKITVSSIDMAEYFVSAGWNDITIAFPLNPRQLSKIQYLALKVILGVVIEDISSVHQLGETIQSPLNIWLKIDSGTHRTGILWDKPEIIEQILRELKKFPNLIFQGILTHAGSTYSAQSAEEAIRLHKESTSRMTLLQQTIIEAGFQKPLISIGDTPGCCLVDNFLGVDEIRPGNFVFFDAEQFEIGSCSEYQIAVALACPIVAQHPDRNEVVIYGGAIHLSKESFLHKGRPSYGLVSLPNNDGWGEILPDCTVVKLSQEHGILSVPGQLMPGFPIGGLAMIIPTHSCLTAHLMRRYLTLDGQSIEMMSI